MLGDDAAEAATTHFRHNSGRLEPRRVKNCVREFNKRLQRLCAEYDSDSRDIKSFFACCRPLHTINWPVNDGTLNALMYEEQYM